MAIELGVIKCRAITNLPEGQRFSGEPIELIRGPLRKPPTTHVGSRIRTHIRDVADDEDGDAQDGDDAQDIHVQPDEDPQQDEILDQVSDAQKIMQTRTGLEYNFSIKARDVTKCMPTAGCPGCKFATRQVNTQCGHSPECKRRVMEMMTNDRED